MKKTILFTWIMFVFTHSILAVDVNDRHILLSGYIYSCENMEVGQLILTGGDNEHVSFRLEGGSAKYFKLEGNRLVVKKNHCGNRQQWHDLVICANTNKGVVRDTVKVVKDEFLRNKVVAHRGAWKNTGETENSIGSLIKAIDMGCAISELDVNLSADGVLFVNHDAVIQNVKIDTAQSALLSSLKLSNGEHLPTLESYILEAMRQSKTRLLIEVKPFGVSKIRAREAAEATVRLVHKLRAQAWVMYISFSQDILTKIRELAPYADVCYLNGDIPPNDASTLKYDGIDYHRKVFFKNLEWITLAQELALTTNAWVVNKEEEILFFLEKGTDWITTDEPELLFRTIENFNKL